MRFYILLSITLFISISALAQESSKKMKKSKWYIANFNFTYAKPLLFNSKSTNNSILQLFKNNHKNLVAKEKTNFDINSFSAFSRNGISNFQYDLNFLNLEMGFRRLTSKKNSFFHFFELRTGLGYAQYVTGIQLWGDSTSGDKPDTLHRRFSSNYFFTSNAIKANLSLSFQTPKVFNTLSLYTCLGFYWGRMYHTSLETSLSKLETETLPPKRFSSNTQYIRDGTSQFNPPKNNIGITYSLGLQFKVIPTVSLRVGYIYNQNYFQLPSSWITTKHQGGEFSLILNINENGKRIFY